MKKLIGFAAILVVLFLSGNVFAEDLIVKVSSGFGCNGPKRYEVAKKDLVNKDETPYFSWNEAVTACKELKTSDGKDDWELPSKGVLNAMYKQLHKEGKGGFVQSFYWTSFELIGDNAWLKSFIDGSEGYGLKNLIMHVRCVRAL